MQVNAVEEKRSGSRFVTVLTSVGIVALAAGGFTLSFDALRDLAARSGTPQHLAWVWPLTVDGFIVIATLAAFTLAKAGRRTTWYPWAALCLFAVISITGNALHAINHEDQLGVATPVAVMVSSIPAIALLVASHLLVVMVGFWTKPAEPLTNTVAVATPINVNVESLQPVPIVEIASATASDEQVDTVALNPGPSGEALPVLSKADRLQQIINWLAEDPTVQAARIEKHFGLSSRTARRDLSEARSLVEAS